MFRASVKLDNLVSIQFKFDLLWVFCVLVFALPDLTEDSSAPREQLFLLRQNQIMESSCLDHLNGPGIVGKLNFFWKDNLLKVLLMVMLSIV